MTTPAGDSPGPDRSSDRRVIVLQNRLAQSQDQFQSMNDKLVQERRQWEARVKEFESRQKAAEEKVRRERQGVKERHGEQESLIKLVVSGCNATYHLHHFLVFRQLREEIEAANRRKKQVRNVMRVASQEAG
jgi:hypothetical protein